MSNQRLKNITPIGVEKMGDLADSLADPDVLRLENLDTNMPPPTVAIDTTLGAIHADDANSYLPFLGQNDLRAAATNLVGAAAGRDYDWKTECVIAAGGLSGILNVLLASLEPGDGVLLTDPTYVGLINRVHLAGGIPRFVPMLATGNGWRLDKAALQTIDPDSVKVALLMSPSMPSGAVFDREEWQSLIDFCRRADCWLINDSAMERLLFDGRQVIHPASFDGMRERVITVGSASKEFRMIGWRVGWVVGPATIMADVARVSIANVVCQTGIAMGAVTAAMRADDDGIAACVVELEARRDLIVRQLEAYDVIPPHGGWSLLVDVSSLGIDGAQAARRLLKYGKIAATPMVNWGGASCANYLRLVFSNESSERLADLGNRFDIALNRDAPS